ncbi:MAG: trypsin-like peptidase domain-containing protein [Myxococcales bacterium]|nr:trypsin-like peptidase domain-containing protein [Myxococcales bacterium]
MTLLETLSEELEQLVAKVAPGVVALEHSRGHGTGVVLAQDGYLLTNAHVVRGAAKVGTRFADGEEAAAEVVGSDPQSDLAVLRSGRSAPRALPLADSSKVKVGQLVVAVGHPFGFERSVSLGVVSALERRLPAREVVLDGLIQTDAAINPGNSGGPLLSIRGEVVGINTAMLPFAQGIGFAVPASTVSWVAALLIHDGAVRRRYLGIAARSESLPSGLAGQIGQLRGVRVLGVGSGTPASSGGLKEEDLLLSVNGEELRGVDDLQRILAYDRAPEARLSLWRLGRRAETRVRPELRRAA